MTEKPMICAVAYCGMLAHAHLKMEQKIRGNEKHQENRIKAVGLIYYHLGRMHSAVTIADVLTTAERVFAQVEKRDWIKYPETGFPPKEDMSLTTPDEKWGNRPRAVMVVNRV